MRKEVAAEFGNFKPRALVLDDHPNSRRATAITLSARGFDVSECETTDQFNEAWAPGMFDLIVADWQLSDRDHGDQVLVRVRLSDWDVPFVLVSGKLDEDDMRVKVLEVLLEHGGARFVARGSDGIERACDEGEALIERRDMTLLKIILALREGAMRGATIQSSSGLVTMKQQLATLVAAPVEAHKTTGALSALRSGKVLRGEAG
jgi:CheY-like chemotaxis protein